MRLVVRVVVALCASARVSGSQTPFASVAAAYAHTVDTASASKPPSCRIHGGSAPVRPAAPILSLGGRVDRQLDSLDLGEMWIRVYAVHGGDPVGAGYWIEPRSRTGGIEQVDRTWVRLRQPAGTYLLRILNGTNDWRDSIRIRRGVADTLVLGFGHLWMCGQ